jgi:hypothetical protein
MLRISDVQRVAAAISSYFIYPNLGMIILDLK